MTSQTPRCWAQVKLANEIGTHEKYRVLWRKSLVPSQGIAKALLCALTEAHTGPGCSHEN